MITDTTKKCDGRKEMDVTKVFGVLCGFLLIVCLTLSITCLVVMRNAVEETTAWQARAEELVGVLDDCVQAMRQEDLPDIPVIAPDTEQTVPKAERYCVKINASGLGVYDSDGYLIQHAQMQLSLLPPAERKQLADGIWVESWGDAMRLLQDYEE